MNLKEFAEKAGITLDEAKEVTGLTHWNQAVPEEIVAELDGLQVEEEPVAEEEPGAEEEPVKLSPEQIELKWRAGHFLKCFGEDSPEYTKALSQFEQSL